MKTHLVGIIGWLGVVLVIGSYALISFSIILPTSLAYQLLNLLGALGIATETYFKKDYQPFWLNVIWSVIAIVAIANISIHL